VAWYDSAAGRKGALTGVGGSYVVQLKRESAADSPQMSKCTVFVAIGGCGSRAELGGAEAFTFV
jgi:hypothetical protein